MAIVVNDGQVQIESLELGSFGTNAYIVICLKTNDSLVIDAPDAADRIMERLQGTNPRYILLTHGHFDHTGALAELHEKLNVPLGVHPLDAGHLPVKPEQMLKDGNIFSLGKLLVEVLHTPGHTPGSLCFHLGRYLLSGDTIFTAGPGRTGSPAAFRQIIESITGRIFTLPGDTRIFPGHGQATVLKQEKDEYEIFASREHSPNLCGDIVWLTS